jgi:hypothetical protein
MKTTTVPSRNLLNRAPLRAFFLIPFVLACFAISSGLQAVCREGCSGDVTYLGEDALATNSGGGNTAVGGLALSENTTGYVNTAVGDVALFLNTTGFANTAIGAGALQNNRTGFQNTATGDSALQDNVGSNNTATGWNALFFNTTGNNNTAMGYRSDGGQPRYSDDRQQQYSHRFSGAP